MQAFIKFVTEDWYFAFPLFLMSLTGLTLILWRLLLNYNASVSMSAFLPVFQQILEKEGVQRALAYCQNRTEIIPKRLYVAGLEAHKQGLAAVRRAMANAIELEIAPDLNFLLPPILAIAKVATMVGLFGTVISMINTFQKIQDAKGGGVADQASAIGLALFATALGLITAIPLVFAHVLFKSWVGRFELRMKSAAHRLLFLLQNIKQPAGKGGAPAAPQIAADPTGITRR